MSWYNPFVQELWTQETVDIGWIYLLVKLGIVGLAVFVWLLADLLRRSLKDVPCGVQLSLVLLVVFFAIEMVAEAMFVYFMAAAWAGIACGFLQVLSCRSSGEESFVRPVAG